MDSVVQHMRSYLAAGATLDLEAFDAFYAPEFENIRTDRLGQVVTITREQLMTRLAQLKAANQPFAASTDEDTEILGTSWFGSHCSLLMRRVKDGRPVLYNFIWRQESDGRLQIVREFTFEEDLSYLLQLIARAKAGAAEARG